MEYMIIENDRQGDFLSSLNKKLAQGWRPHGSLVIYTMPGDPGYGAIVFYCQAIVRDQVPVTVPLAN